MSETNLILGLTGLPPQSARNCVQELSPIANGEFENTLDGRSIFVETCNRRRYRSIITCNDANSPLADGIWIGSQLLVGCIQNLWQAIEPGETEIKLIRPAVSSSILAINNFGEHIKFREMDNSVKLYRPYNERIFVCFRPWLTMHVINFSLKTDEWGERSGWQLILEEV